MPNRWSQKRNGTAIPFWELIKGQDKLLKENTDYEEPLFSEPIIGTHVIGQIESDSEQYVAEQIWRKQMQYEESDRYVQMSALQYGL